jgi:hypothetical protein
MYTHQADVEKPERLIVIKDAEIEDLQKRLAAKEKQQAELEVKYDKCLDLISALRRQIKETKDALELDNYPKLLDIKDKVQAKPKDLAAQAFREYSRCIFEGKRAKPKQANDNQEEISGGRYVTRARNWRKRGDVDACAAQTNMQCWVHQGIILNDEQADTNLREAWEHESSKDEMNIVLQGLEQHFWRGTKAGWIGCYDFPGETWAGDGSVHKCVMGAGSVCLQRPGCNLVVRVGREEEGVSSLRPELAAIARTL